MRKAVVTGAALAVAALVVIVVMRVDRGVHDAPQSQSGEVALEEERGAREAARPAAAATAGRGIPAASQSEEGESPSDANAEPEEPQTEEEKLEAEKEKLVNDFDDLTDRWTEPSPKGVTMADVDGFAKSFRRLPKERQDECVHRALNLIPDENVMLLAGILMDKSMDKEIVETVYNDVLNRDEDVKKPILQQIFKDKAHPCWADTAWILDVTDEIQKAK